MRVLSRIRSLLLTALLIATILLPGTLARAEGLAAVLVSSATAVTVGDTLTITVRIDAILPEPIENYDTQIQYDPARFAYVSAANLIDDAIMGANDSGGTVAVTAYGGSEAGASSLCSLTFKALSTGQATFSATDNVVNNESAASAGFSVNVTAPLPAVNTLKTLKVSAGTLSPAFAAATTRYALQLPAGTTSITVSATPTDSAAKVSVSGQKSLKTGDNTIKITVTAQNGDKKTYTIVATIAEPTPAASSETTVTETLATTGVTAPASEAETSQPDDSLVRLQTAAHTFTVLEPPADLTAPAGFVLSSLTIDGLLLTGWQPETALAADDPAAGTYLLYLMNEDGQRGFYLYQPLTQLIYPYLQTVPAATLTPSLPAATPTVSPAAAAATVRSGSWFVAALIFAALSLVLLVLLIWIYLGHVRQPEPPLQNNRRPPEIRRIT